MDDGDRFSLWNTQLDLINHEILQLTHIDDVFWQVQAILAENTVIPERGVILEWFGRTYTNTMAAGLRRLVDSRRDTVSLSRLLKDMAQHCTILTRERYRELHRDWLRANVDPWFVELAGADLDHIPRARILALVNRLELAFESVTQFANEQVTHHAANRVATATFDDVRLALVESFLVFDWCSRVLQSAVQHNAVPTILEDWLRVFTVPWIGPSSQASEYKHLDQLVETRRKTFPV